MQTENDKYSRTAKESFFATFIFKVIVSSLAMFGETLAVNDWAIGFNSFGYLWEKNWRQNEWLLILQRMYMRSLMTICSRNRSSAMYYGEQSIRTYLILFNPWMIHLDNLPDIFYCMASTVYIIFDLIITE